MFKSFSFPSFGSKDKEKEAKRVARAQRRLVHGDLQEQQSPGLEDLLEDALLEATPETTLGVMQTLEMATAHDERQTLELFATVIHNSSVFKPPPGTKDVAEGELPTDQRIIDAFREVLHGFLTEEQPDADLDKPEPIFVRIMDLFRAALATERAHAQQVNEQDPALLQEEDEERAERDSVGAHDAAFDSGSAFLLHKAVWLNDERALGELLFDPEPDRPPNVSEYDLRGNTPLHLAVRLGNSAAVRLLIDHGANPKKKNALGWTVLDEAVATGDRDVVTAVYVGMQRVAWKKWNERREFVMAALEKLPDFYMELKWEFESSFMPFINAMAPSDVYRIWKKKSSVRVDTTLIGFDNFKAVRGSLSILFMGANSDCPGDVFIVDREERTILDGLQKLRDPTPDDVVDEVDAIMRADLMQGRLNAKDLSFMPSKTLLGNPKVETVGRWRNTRVYEATGTFTVKILRRKVDVKWLDAREEAEEEEQKKKELEILKENERRDRLRRGMPPLEESEQAIGSSKWKQIPFTKKEKKVEQDLAARKEAAEALRRRKALEAVEKRKSGLSKQQAHAGPSYATLAEKQAAAAAAAAAAGPLAAVTVPTGRAAAFFKNILRRKPVPKQHLRTAPPDLPPFEDYFDAVKASEAAEAARLAREKDLTTTKSIFKFAKAATRQARQAKAEKGGKKDPKEKEVPVKRTEFRRKVKATVWLSEDFDISVPDIIPVLDIITSTGQNRYMSKVKDLLALKFPTGLFPVKLSIPLMLSVQAVATFQRFERVSHIADEVFLVPPDYRARVPGSAEDQMLQHLKTLQTKTEGNQTVGKGFDWMHR